jgi:hypothetical protein
MHSMTDSISLISYQYSQWHCDSGERKPQATRRWLPLRTTHVPVVPESRAPLRNRYHPLATKLIDAFQLAQVIGI